MKASTDSGHLVLSLKGMPLRFAIVAMTAICMAGCHASAKSEFHSKYKKIQLDMSEGEVDHILAEYPCRMRDLHEEEKEDPGDIGDTSGPLKRKGSSVKTYDCKPGANEGDFYINVYFDENYEVVGKAFGTYIS